jgi:hypothetical protein
MGHNVDHLVASLFNFLPGTPRFVMATLLEDRGETELAEALKQNTGTQSL